MRHFAYLIPALYAGNIQPGSLSATCSLNGDVQVDFSYEPAEMNLDYVFVGESNSTTCGHGTNLVTLTKTDDSAGVWRISYNRNTCGYEGDIFMANTTVSFSEGRSTGSHFLALKRQTVDVVCAYENFHSVQFDFSMNKTLEEYDATASTSGGLQFRLDAFSDAERQTELSLDTLYSGTQVYLSLSAVVAEDLRSQLNFAPSKCVFSKIDETGADQSFTLFESTENNCGQTFPELGFSLDFRAADRIWDISYKLFTFGENVASSYRLDCDVLACYTADGMEPCRVVAEQCDDEYNENIDIWSPPVESESSGTLTVTTEFSKVSYYGMASDDDYYYIPSRDDNELVMNFHTIVFALDKSTGEVAKMYVNPSSSSFASPAYSVAVCDDFVIGVSYLAKGV